MCENKKLKLFLMSRFILFSPSIWTNNFFFVYHNGYIYFQWLCADCAAAFRNEYFANFCAVVKIFIVNFPSQYNSLLWLNWFWMASVGNFHIQMRNDESEMTSSLTLPSHESRVMMDFMNILFQHPSKRENMYIFGLFHYFSTPHTQELSYSHNFLFFCGGISEIYYNLL